MFSHFFLFFFFKQKTAYEMRISDWSSRRVLFRSLAGALLPRLEHREHHSIRLALAEEAKASHHKHARHNVLLIVKFLHLTHRFFSPLTGRAGGSLYNSDDSPLVILREESTGTAREQDNRQADQRDEYELGRASCRERGCHSV